MYVFQKENGGRIVFVCSTTTLPKLHRGANTLPVVGSAPALHSPPLPPGLQLSPIICTFFLVLYVPKTVIDKWNLLCNFWKLNGKHSKTYLFYLVFHRDIGKLIAKLIFIVLLCMIYLQFTLKCNLHFGNNIQNLPSQKPALCMLCFYFSQENDNTGKVSIVTYMHENVIAKGLLKMAATKNLPKCGFWTELCSFFCEKRLSRFFFI